MVETTNSRPDGRAYQHPARASDVTAPMMLRAAVDIGGTFTDLQILNPGSGVIYDFKSLTTPEDPSVGLINALTGAARKFDFPVDRIGMILHGSTIATNAVLERKLPPGALITTRGFTDVLEIGRHMRHNVYALRAEERSVLIPRRHRFGVVERIRADGTVETPLDTDAVARIGEDLAEKGIRAVAVTFLHGYRNPVHEQQSAEILSAIPGLSVATSAETSPEIREFERMSTTVLNALLKPVISDYLDRVEARLASAGINARLFLVQSNGGVATPVEAARLPARLLLSGPAGGAMAVADLARRHGFENLVGVDMGGTSTDVSVIQGGVVEETAMGEIDGLPVRLPMVEIRTIGAGGGSIARVESGALRVGPHSAGAQPGPACYLRGGTEPTVTDANLHLGLIDPAGFLGGEMRLGSAEANAALRSVGSTLGLTAADAASGILRVATSSMAAAVRLSLFEKGADPSDFVLASFGGAGGLHACAIADELGIDGVLFPATASTLSARGILSSDLRHDLSMSELLIAGPEAVPDLGRMAADLIRRGDMLLAEDGIAAEKRRIELSADMRYRGQAYEINTVWAQLSDPADVSAASVAQLTKAFHDLHRARYAHSSEDDAVEIVTLRAKAVGLLEKSTLRPPESAEGTQPPTARKIWTDGTWRETPVIARHGVGPTALAGPLVVEEPYSVLWIAPDWSVRALDTGDLMAERNVRAEQ